MDSVHQQPRSSHEPARQSHVLPQHQQRRFDAESWIEVSSQPSSSSLSSIGDEIVTTGLQVNPQFRRRRMPASARSLPQERTAMYVGTSSQEDNDSSETDDDDDRRLASSAENIASAPEEDGADDSSEEEDESDDGDNATALGGRTAERPTFQPQPNAFSHPPRHPQRSYSTNAAMPSHPHSGFTRPSFSQRSQTRVHRGPHFMSPSSREDNDEALRASLTTLLSCAAAARGLPKTKEEAEAQRMARHGVGPGDQPMDLRLVPESELQGDDEPATQAMGDSLRRKRSSPARSPSRAEGAAGKVKRSSSARATKKKRTIVVGEEALVSPTLMTWVVSAGVVVLVSVVGFGAGYVIGREVGRQDALSASVGGMNDTASCGREAIRGSSGTLRRFKWSTVGKSIVA